MTQDEIIKMAIDAELNLYVHDLTEKQYIEVIEHFAKLVAAKEREACAQICEQFADADSGPEGIFIDYHAHLIRARGE
jgi:hypothetical protein